MRSLKYQIIIVAVLLLGILATLVWLSVGRSFEDRVISEEYVLKIEVYMKIDMFLPII